MRTRARLLTTAAIAALTAACLLWAWRAHTAARDLENRRAKLAAQTASLKERLRALNAQSNAGIDAAGAPEETNAAKTDRENPPSKREETALERMSRFAAENALRNKREKTPEFQKKQFAAQRVDLGIVYGPFFRLAGLTPGQAAKLTDALQQRDETKADIGAVRREQAGHEDDPVWQDLLNEANNETQAAAQAILGDEGFAQFQLYERQLRAWTSVENIAAGLALADLPMSFEQSQKLVEAMSHASASFQSGKAMEPNLTDVDWSAVDAEARKILTPGQFELFSTTAFDWGATPRNIGINSRWQAEFFKALNSAMKPEAGK